MGIAIRRAIERTKNGAKLPSFGSIDEALNAASSRTDEEKYKPYMKDESSQPQAINQKNLNLSQLLAMEGKPLNTDLIQGASTQGILGALSPIADAIEFADENISGPASMMIPTGTSEYIRKLQYGDDIGYLDRLFANPLLWLLFRTKR
jgi:hypothetical protein